MYVFLIDIADLLKYLSRRFKKTDLIYLMEDFIFIDTKKIQMFANNIATGTTNFLLLYIFKRF